MATRRYFSHRYTRRPWTYQTSCRLSNHEVCRGPTGLTEWERRRILSYRRLTMARGTTPPHFTEVSVSEQGAADRRLTADEVGAIPDALRRSLPTEMPEEGHDPVSSDIELRQQPAALDQHNLV